MRSPLAILLALLPLASLPLGSVAMASQPKETHPVQPARFPRSSREGIVSAIARLSTLPGGWERTRAASEAFLGARYRRAPLGDGGSSGPRLRWDAVDCLTFVETSLAVGEARSLDEVEPILDDIRYEGGKAPSFESRLHLMEAQWIPDLIRKGYVEEATRRLGGDRVIEASVTYTAESWAKREDLKGQPWSPRLAGTHSIPVIPLDAAIELGPSLPEGLVLNVVRVPAAGKVSLITHTGLVVVKDGKRFVRHAALAEREVIDEPIERFLRRHAGMRSRRVLGVNLLAVRPNAERARRAAESRLLDTSR
ncbi:N-acetylmuramoyl-L-alanine amidase-like domain-containing protein [Vulgatibacter incomptus]|uniref:Putative ribosephosphate isomerase n=1 Tax=Vulgatibacter incomptus TaxID=1391653 RepID=A0A0K1P8Z5_9BACT|nr:N-acetylmuramoyl-L-alanine amidase-like domain-containing protein [Vulgatibacter incomptus]AKU89995.1 putative ribosephosphate isomerase [Vulgatibacter incomptus]